jgi:hypothetical protein
MYIGNQVLNITNFNGIDYMHNIYIYDCETVNIKPHAFSQMAVITRIQFSNINELNLSPLSFAHMLHIPRIIHIQSTVIRNLYANTFAGIHNTHQILLRNVTIEHIHSNAFQQISNVTYIYIRQSKIANIHTLAFGNMYNVANLFIRASTHIDKVEENIFGNSFIHNINIEDVDINSQHVNSFAASNNKYMQIHNCTIRGLKYHNTNNNYNLDEMNNNQRNVEITSTQMIDFALCPYSNTNSVKIHNCNIGAIIPIVGCQLKNINKVDISNSQITNIRSQAMQGTENVSELVFTNVTIIQVI